MRRINVLTSWLIFHAGPCRQPKVWGRISFVVVLAFAFALILTRRRLFCAFWPQNSRVNHQSSTTNFIRCIIFHRTFAPCRQKNTTSVIKLKSSCLSIHSFIHSFAFIYSFCILEVKQDNNSFVSKQNIIDSSINKVFLQRDR